MNKVFLLGNLTKDPERFGQTVRFSIAVNKKTKTEDGKNDVNFFNCTAFSNTAEYIITYFKKGERVLIEGRLDNYTNPEGRTFTSILVSDIQSAGAIRRDGNSNSDRSEPRAAIQAFNSGINTENAFGSMKKPQSVNYQSNSSNEDESLYIDSIDSDDDFD